MSSINDGIPDVWKDYYGFSLSDPELAQADYNGTGTSNPVKYLGNLWPLDSTPPQIQPKSKPAPVKKSATPAAKAAAPPADAPGNLIKGGSFSGVDHPLPNHQSKGYLGGGFDWGFVPEDKISGGWKALKGDKIEVWKTDDGKQFVELNANAANNGIEQKVNGIQPGTYVLTWRDMGRESANADGSNYGVFVFTKKKTQDTANNGKNAGALEGRTDILKPPYETAGKWGDWKTKVVVFTVSAEDLKNNNLWIAFKPRDEARTYGALIDDVIIFPLGVMPDVLPVNSGFGECRVDSNGFAIPDCDDPGHSLKAQRDHLDGKWKAGDFVTEKLHHGFFGLKPGTLTYSSTTGAVVKIRKLDKDDPDTQRKQSGQVRLYAISGPKGSKQEKAIDLYNPDTLQAYDIGNL